MTSSEEPHVHVLRTKHDRPLQEQTPSLGHYMYRLRKRSGSVQTQPALGVFSWLGPIDTDLASSLTDEGSEQHVAHRGIRKEYHNIHLQTRL